MLFELLVHVTVLITSREQSRDAVEQSIRSIEGTFLRPVVVASKLTVTFAFLHPFQSMNFDRGTETGRMVILFVRAPWVARSLDATARSDKATLTLNSGIHRPNTITIFVRVGAGVQGRIRIAIRAASYNETVRKTSTAFSPPKAKEFESAASTARGRAALGM